MWASDRTRDDIAVPRLIHQTIKDHSRHTKWMDSWKRLNPSYEIKVWTDADIERFFTEHMPNEWTTFERLHHVQKFDFTRYCLIWWFGGWYADSDMECHRPIEQWGVGTNASLVVGTELNYTDAVLSTVRPQTARPIQLAQCFFGATPRHPALRQTIDMIIANARKPDHLFQHRYNNIVATVDKSGPGVFTDGVVTWLASHGIELNDAVGRRPWPALHVMGCEEWGIACEPSLRREHRAKVAQHHYAGSWTSNQV